MATREGQPEHSGGNPLKKPILTALLGGFLMATRKGQPERSGGNAFTKATIRPPRTDFLKISHLISALLSDSPKAPASEIQSELQEDRVRNVVVSSKISLVA